MHRRLVNGIGQRTVRRRQQVGKAVAVLIVEGRIDAHVAEVGIDSLLNLIVVNIRNLRQFLGRRITMMLLLKLLYHRVDLRQRTHLVKWQAHHTALFGDGLQDALAYPPHGIADELKPAGLIKFLCSLHQSNVALIDEVGQRQSLMLVLFGHRNDETQVSRDEFVLGTLALLTATPYLLGQILLLIEIDHRNARYLA